MGKSASTVEVACDHGGTVTRGAKVGGELILPELPLQH